MSFRDKVGSVYGGVVLLAVLNWLGLNQEAVVCQALLARKSAGVDIFIVDSPSMPDTPICLLLELYDGSQWEIYYRIGYRRVFGLPPQ